MNLFALFEENHRMLLDVDAVADAGGHGHPTFTDVVVVVVNHDIEAERLRKEVVGDAQRFCGNCHDVGGSRAFTGCFEAEFCHICFVTVRRKTQERIGRAILQTGEF